MFLVDVHYKNIEILNIALEFTQQLEKCVLRQSVFGNGLTKNNNSLLSTITLMI